MIKILSKRAHVLLQSPHHFKEIGERHVPLHLYMWELSIDSKIDNDLLSDKILTLFYSHSTDSQLMILFSEAICRLVMGRNIQFLKKLTFREVDNYLRDENHLPVFDKSLIDQAEIAFKVVKNSLLAEIILGKIKNITPSIDPHTDKQKTWASLSLLEKNLTAKRIIFQLNLLFPIGKMLELVLVDNDEISVVRNEFPIDLDVIEELLGRLLTISDQKSSLKVVAVQ